MQLALFSDLPIDESYDAEDFICTQANKEAVLWVNKWPNAIYHGNIAQMPANSHAMMIYGPSGCGKTHLAKYWQKRMDASIMSASALDESRLAVEILQEKHNIILEECHSIQDERAWFHVFNMAKEANVALLMTSRKSPEEQNIALPDLRSRLSTVPAVEIEMPDQELVQMLILRYCAKHQLSIDGQVIEYIAMRVERSYEALEGVMNKINQKSLEKGKKITIPFVRDEIKHEL